MDDLETSFLGCKLAKAYFRQMGSDWRMKLGTFLSCWCPRVEFCAPGILGHNCQQLRELDVSKSRLNDVFKEQNITRKAVQLLLLKALGLGKTITEIDGSMKLVNGSLSSVVSWLIRWFDFRAPFFFAQFLGWAFVCGSQWLFQVSHGESFIFFDPGSSSLGILEAGKGSKRRSRWCTWRRGNCGCRRLFCRDFLWHNLQPNRMGNDGSMEFLVTRFHKFTVEPRKNCESHSRSYCFFWRPCGHCRGNIFFCIVYQTWACERLYSSDTKYIEGHSRTCKNYYPKGCAFSPPDKIRISFLLKFLVLLLCFVET